MNNQRKDIAQSVGASQKSIQNSQLKPVSLPARQPPTAPPAYRPQTVPRVLQSNRVVQAKRPASGQSLNQPRLAPTAPPVYRPQLTPKVLQRKLVSGQHPPVGQLPRQTGGVIQPAWGKGGSKSGLDALGSKPPPIPLPIVKPKVAVTYQWFIAHAARGHYNDGWGAAYGITNDDALKDHVIDTWTDGENDDGSKIEIYLGIHTVKGETKGCNVYYRKDWNDAGTECTRFVWHCGPSVAAG